MTDDKDTIFNRRFLAGYALLLTISAMAYVYLITFATVPKDNAAFANTVLGFIMGTVLATPIGFYYGSSKSSQAKDQALAAQLPPAPGAPPESAPVPPTGT